MPESIINIMYDALYLIFPAYCADAAPVILGGGSPIDAGKIFLDGRPILGSRKTIRGFFAGLAIGTFVGFIQNNVLLGFMLSLGAQIGDLTESFIKRRIGFPPRASLPVADQLDFVAGALLFSLLVSQPTLPVILITIIITPPIHLFTNCLAYLLGVKKEPW